MTFRIGQHVVFVNPDGVISTDYGPASKPLVHGREYVIADFDLHAVYETGVGIVVKGRQRDGWDSSFFRPVTDISIFTEILERETIPSTEKEKV